MIVEDSVALLWDILILGFAAVLVVSFGWIIAHILRDSWLVLTGNKEYEDEQKRVDRVKEKE